MLLTSSVVSGVHFQDKIQNFPSAFEILQERVHAREFEVRRRIK